VLGILASVGDTAGALREYDAFAKRLKEDYDASPSPETKALAEQLRTSEAVRTPSIVPIARLTPSTAVASDSKEPSAIRSRIAIASVCMA
jgi:DNA-binding SARP family transcriptional activator